MIKEEYSLEEVLNIPLIKEARDSYKKLGKDPSRYRLAVESLYRRLVKGYGLYRINNVVDAGNILSDHAPVKIEGITANATALNTTAGV